MAKGKSKAGRKQSSGIKILIINLHSSYNAGDDVLTRVTISQLKQSFVHPQIILAMNDPASHDGQEKAVGSFMSWLKPKNKSQFSWGVLKIPWLLSLCLLTVVFYRLFGVPKLDWMSPARRELVHAYLEADLVVSSAGNFLYSSGYGITLLVTLFTIKYAMLLGKPVYMMPQTVGPLSHGWERKLTAFVLRGMRLCFVRDAISKLELEKMKVWAENCTIVPDMAFLFPSVPPKDGQTFLPDANIHEKRQSWLGVTLINWEAQNKLFRQQARYETAVAAAIRHFVQVYNGVVFLFGQVRGPTSADDDIVPARRVKKKLAQLENKVVLVEKVLSAEQLKAAYGQMDLFIGTRLHSNIFALSQGVPAILIQYQYKTEGVAKMLDLEEWVLNIETIEPNAIICKLDALANQEHELRRKITNTVAKIEKQIVQVSEKIAADFENL
ncbi:polysaccharide pyruvyl transferase family protein [Candidatus Leptofilum sp.]|uniref:polysaccharide pyruvyl transferase family protein n=1 Tax=Candidatus Leptofilum sp. TaxID=3241576 RepID=UPI003B5CB71E